MAGESVWRRRAPVWLRILAGVLIFPTVTFVIALLGGIALRGSIASPLPPWLLIFAAIAGAVVSFIVSRKSSTPVAAILVALPLLGYAWAFVALQQIGNSERPFGEAQPGAPAGQPEPWPDTFNRPSGSGAAQSETETPVEPQAQPAPAPTEGEPRYEVVQLPEFPWPPPAASASYVLPDTLLASYHTVGAVVGEIISALERSGYVERSFFRTEAGGVALVTRLERINDDGTSSAATERWPGDRQHYESRDSLFQFLKGLFYVDAGHYRVIVFILQDLPFSQSSANITGEEARAWLTTGANVLPPEIAARPFGGSYGGHCTALIYEFASDGTKVRVVESRLTGKEHLDKAGLLAALATNH